MDLVVTVLAACEVGFWVLVVLGLATRYVLRWGRTGLALLAMTPVVDLALLATVIVDLRGGGTAGSAHGLAAVYLGTAVAYGHKMIAWADARFAHRFAHGVRPGKLYGAEYARECWKDVGRTTVAVGIAAGVLVLLTALVDESSKTDALAGIYPVLGLWYVIDLVWAISFTFWPRTRPAVLT